MSQPQLHRANVDIPKDLWDYYQYEYKPVTRRSFSSFVIDSLRNLRDEELEKEARRLEITRSRRLNRVNSHLDK